MNIAILKQTIAQAPRIAIVVLSLFLTKAGLLAQTPVYLGTSNQFPVGHNNIPARVYMTFLQEKIDHDTSNLYPFSHKCYDPCFMTVVNRSQSQKNPVACIQCYSGYWTYYNYSLIPGHEEDIICAVSSAELQAEFGKWFDQHKTVLNHTRNQLAQYINDKINARNGQNASLAKINEFESCDFSSKEAQQIVQNNADLIVEMICSPHLDEEWVPSYLLNFWGLGLSTIEDPAFPDMPKHVVIKKEGEDREEWSTNQWSRDPSENETILVDNEEKGELRIERGVLVLTGDLLFLKKFHYRSTNYASSTIIIPVGIKFLVRLVEGEVVYGEGDLYDENTTIISYRGERRSDQEVIQDSKDKINEESQKAPSLINSTIDGKTHEWTFEGTYPYSTTLLFNETFSFVNYKKTEDHHTFFLNFSITIESLTDINPQ